jgi:hypothetical protein
VTDRKSPSSVPDRFGDRPAGFRADRLEAATGEGCFAERRRAGQAVVWRP